MPILDLIFSSFLLLLCYLQILAEKGDMEEAMEVFKEAVKLEPDNKAVIQVWFKSNSAHLG